MGDIKSPHFILTVPLFTITMKIGETKDLVEAGNLPLLPLIPQSM